jgi:hypothetical protein
MVRPIRLANKYRRQATIMKRSKPTRQPIHSKSIHDVTIQKNIVELALCHVVELIDLTQEIASDMHVGMTHPEVISHISGRLITLMYCAKRELEEAQRAIALS